MNKQAVIEFFDRHASTWDAELVHNDTVINKILDGARISAGKNVLDVACGTGVLIPDYLARDVATVTAIDISPEMARICAEKFPQDNVTVMCGDVEEMEPDLFDCVMVYNAFPHFSEPNELLRKLSQLVCPGGTVTIAHGMSRDHIDAHHKGAAKDVSIGLMPVDALAAMMGFYFRVIVKISDEHMYQVTGIKR